MPRQTPSRNPRRSAAPYPSPKRKRQAVTSVSTSSSTPIQAPVPAPVPAPAPAPIRVTGTANPTGMNTHMPVVAAGATMNAQAQGSWQHPPSHSHSMPPPRTTYHQPRLSMVDRMAPTHSPTGLPTSSSPPGTSGPWSSRDDEILMAARAQSQGWSQIQRENFPSKSSNACRKRYERLVAKSRSSGWDDERVDRVAAQYMQLREQTWRPLADAVGEDWRDIEKLCLERGARTLLPTVGHQEMNRMSGHASRHSSHDSHDDEKLSIHNLLQ